MLVGPKAAIGGKPPPTFGSSFTWDQQGFQLLRLKRGVELTDRIHPMPRAFLVSQHCQQGAGGGGRRTGGCADQGELAVYRHAQRHHA